MKAKFVVLILVCCIVSLAPTVSAQDDAEDVVTAALAATTGVDTMQIVSESRVMGPDDVALSAQTTELVLQRIEDGWDAQIQSSNLITTPMGELMLVSETVRVAGVTYIRFTEVPEQLNMLPTDWINLATLGEQAGTVAALGQAEPDAALRVFELPVLDAAVTAITQIDDSVIDGQAVSLYQVTFDSNAILASDYSDILELAASGGQGMMQQGRTPGQGAENAPGGNLEAIDPTALLLTLTLYIGQDDGFIHQVDTIIATADTDADPFTLRMTQTNFSNFNEPVEIQEPTLSS